MSPLIALVGRKGVGKTTIAHHLVATGFIEVSFADVLKESLSMLLGVSRTLFDDPASKETPFVVPGQRMTPREMMQQYGDAAKQLFGQNVFIDAVRHRIAELRSEESVGIIISDVRFPAEAEFVRELGARIYRVVESCVVRIDHGDVVDTDRIGPDHHQSECLQQGIDCDAVIGNDGVSLDALRTALDDEFRITTPAENVCIRCGLDLGACNPRQLCGKTTCEYDDP
jgi:hypothetical protein